MSAVKSASEPNPAAFVYVALSGEQERGSPGVVWVDRDAGECRYLLVAELTPADLRTGITELVEKDAGEHYFIVVKDALHVHVMTHRKEAARAALKA